MQLLKYKKCSFIIVYVSMCWITFSLFISFIYQILTEKEVDMDIIKKVYCCCLVMSDYLQPRGLQQTRHPCPSLSPGFCSNSYPLSWWCHPAITSSATPFSSCPLSFPVSVFSYESALWIRLPKMELQL